METIYYTPQEIAQLFKVAPYTVSDWIRKGKLNATKIGSKLWRVSKKDLQDYLREQEEMSDARPNKGTSQHHH